MNQGGKLHILVLCTGNICRSPIAETVLRTMLAEYPGVTVSSAGLSAPLDSPPDPVAETVAGRLGYRIRHDHRSQRLGSRDVAAADLILAMERIHLHRLADRFPTTIGRSYLICHWNNNEEVEDPVGRGEAVFSAVVNKIERGCNQWVQQLLRTGLIEI